MREVKNTMSKIKLILDVVEDMRSLADSIQALCDVIVENDPLETTTKTPHTKNDEKPAVTLETVRALLAEKSQQGKTAEVREIIGKYGCTKLSEISEEHYQDIINDVREI